MFLTDAGTLFSDDISFLRFILDYIILTVFKLAAFRNTGGADYFSFMNFKFFCLIPFG
ncbi:MAG: hypothetical protein GY754_33960 [bacterium]|nr:hypothetical protein [bacterium]